MNGIHQIAGSILGIPLQCLVGIEKENVHGRRGFFGTGHIIVQNFIQIIVESGTVGERCNEIRGSDQNFSIRVSILQRLHPCLQTVTVLLHSISRKIVIQSVIDYETKFFSPEISAVSSDKKRCTALGKDLSSGVNCVAEEPPMARL